MRRRPGGAPFRSSLIVELGVEVIYRRGFLPMLMVMCRPSRIATSKRPEREADTQDGDLFHVVSPNPSLGEREAGAASGDAG